MGETEIRDKLEDYISLLKQKFNLRMVVLYGSFADGTADENSDIDLAVFVDSQKDRDYLQDSALLNRLIIETDTRIEPILYYSEELNSIEQASFLSDILKRGIVLYKN